MGMQEQVAALIAPLARDAGLVVDGVEVSQAGKRRLLRVSVDTAPELDAEGWIDRPTPPVSLDDVAAVSRQIDAALEASDVVGPSAYVLEVSSPGVGRPLRQPRQFQRNVGRLLTARAGDQVVTGRVLRAGTDAVVLSVPDIEAGTEQTIPYAAIDRAAVIVEFGVGADEFGVGPDASADRS